MSASVQSMDVRIFTQGPVHWGERSEAPHGWYIWDFSYIIIYYRRTSDRSNCAWRRTARGLTAHAHRCVKLKQGQSNDKARRAPSLVFLCVFDGIVLSIELTRLLGYYWLSGKLIGTLHIHASPTWLLLHLLQ